MRKLFNKTKKGFTIVELVIVIGVIGILSAILIPTFVNLNSKASDAALKSDLAAVYSSYVADAADGKYEKTGVEVKEMYNQTQVYLRNADTDAGKYYVYGTDGWNIEPVSAPSEPDGYAFKQLGGATNTYTSKEYAVFALEEVVLSPLL